MKTWFFLYRSYADLKSQFIAWTVLIGIRNYKYNHPARWLYKLQFLISKKRCETQPDLKYSGTRVEDENYVFKAHGSIAVNQMSSGSEIIGYEVGRFNEYPSVLGDKKF